MKNGKSTNTPVHLSQLMKLFVDELKETYRAEKALTKATPTAIKNATSQELNDTLTSHLAETKVQNTRLEPVFETINKEAISKRKKIA